MTRTSRRAMPHALGAIVREAVTGPSNYRVEGDFPSG